MIRTLLLSAAACTLVLPTCGSAQSFGLFLNPLEERGVGTKAHKYRLEQRKVVVYNDAQLAAYLERIGRSVARQKARYPDKFVFTLVNDPSLNASAGLGGYLYFHTGTFLWLNDEAEFVSIMGHEVGHAVKRHGAREMNRKRVSTSIMRIAAMRRRNPDALKDMQVKSLLALNSYSRELEFEADLIGSQVLKPMGYDTYAAARMAMQLQRCSNLLAELSGKPNDTPLALRTHPPSMDRVRRNLDYAKRSGGGDLPRNRDRYLAMIDGLTLNLKMYGGPASGRIRIHTVRSGETAQSIAARMPVKRPLSFLLATNGMDSASEIKPGMKIKIVTR